MTRTQLIVIGGGEHARVVIDAAQSRTDEWELVGFCDPRPCPETESRLHVRQLGDDDAALIHPDASLVLGIGAIGSSPLRRRIAARFDRHGVRWATVVHARAIVAATARLEPGATVFAGAVINTGAMVAAHAVVNTGAIVEHDVRVGAFAQIGPAAALGGGVVVEADAYVGLGACVRDHVVVGERALVGMGAVVVGPVAPGERVVGNPARVVRT